MRKIANSKSPFLNPDLNPLLRAVIKPFIYDQFCAGRHKAEIQETIGGIKQLGFAGVILCYAKEIQLNQKNDILGAQGSREADIQKWLDGNLKTLDMIHSGNWLGIK
jgi:proline dehydrogenase